MKSSLARLLCYSTLFLSLSTHAKPDNLNWEAAFADARVHDEQRALSLLQDRYTALPSGFEKLYVSSKIHGFMLVHGQPYFGNSNVIDGEFNDQERLFIAALNSEESLNFTQARDNYLSLLRYAEEEQSLNGKILFEYHLCRALNRQALYHEADVYCSSLNTHIRDINDPIVPKHLALRVIANNHEFLGNYQSALITYQELMTIVPSYVDSSGVYNDAGLLMANLGNYDKAIEYITHALNLRKKQAIPLQLAQTYHSMGKVNLKQKEYQHAISHFIQSRQISQQYNYPYGVTFAELGLGQAQIGLGHYDKGTMHLFNALNNAVKQDNYQLRGEIYLALADVHKSQEKYIAALDFAEHALNLAETVSSERLSAQALNVLADLHELHGNFDMALQYYRQYAQSELKKRDRDHKSATIAFDSTQRDNINQLENKNLANQNRQISAELDMSKQKNLIYALSILVLLLVAFSVVYYQNRQIISLKLDMIGKALNRTNSIKKIKNQPATNNIDLKNVLVLLDIDHFKTVNDLHGYTIGDDLLRLVFDNVFNQLHSQDIIGRLGGEEFVILLKEVDELDVRERVQQLHRTIANTRYPINESEFISITASSAFLATSKALNDFDELFSILDQALRQIKLTGTNSVIDAYHDPIYLDSACATNSPGPHYEI